MCIDTEVDRPNIKSICSRCTCRDICMRAHMHMFCLFASQASTRVGKVVPTELSALLPLPHSSTFPILGPIAGALSLPVTNSMPQEPN